MEGDQYLSEKESLDLIATMIHRARDRFSENGMLYIMWGWLVLICSLVHFVSLYFFDFHQAYFIWLGTWVALVFQVVYLRRKRKKRKFTNYSDAIRGSVWLVFGICTVLLVFILIRVRSFYAINPLILVMYGMPTFLSGIILRLKSLQVGAICCWILSIPAIFVAYEFQLLMIAAAVVVAWLLPGYQLKSKYKSQYSKERLVPVARYE